MLDKEGTDEINLVHDFLQNSVNKLPRYNLHSRVQNCTLSNKKYQNQQIHSFTYIASEDIIYQLLRSG